MQSQIKPLLILKKHTELFAILTKTEEDDRLDICARYSLTSLSLEN